MSEDTWTEVKSKLEGLGLKLKLHLDQEDDDADPTSNPGETKAHVEELGNKIQDAFTSFGTAAKDPAVHADMKEIGTLVKDAMMETFSTVGAEVSDRINKTKDQSGATSTDSASTDTPSADTDTPEPPKGPESTS